MMKKYLSLACVILPMLLCGQANKWINFNQKYYKIKVARDGIYRIDSATLAKAGIPVDSLTAQNIQLFFHGQQQYIYVQLSSTGVFNENKNNYIEFYGQHNTGSLINDAASDSLLYTCVDTLPYNRITAVPNPYYSMFNDTSTYFLTWNNSAANNRVVNAPKNDTAFSSNTPFPYFIAQNVQFGTATNQNYFAGARFYISPDETNDPRYTPTVGWFLPSFGIGQSQTYTLAPSNSVYTGPGAPNAYAKIFFEGQTSNGNNDHSITITTSWPSSPYNVQFTGFTPFVQTFPNITASQLSGTVTMTITSNSVSSTTYNSTAVSYVYFQYPHNTTLSGDSMMMYVGDNPLAPQTYFNFTGLNVGSNDTLRLYDLTNHNRYIVTQKSGSFKILIPNSGNTRQCYITDDNHVNMVSKLIPAGSLGNGKFTNFSGNYTSPYIIITHPLLMPEAQAYYSYRHTRYPSEILANVEELYDQFCYGIEKDPLAIRNFCSYIISQCSPSAPPSALFLIGKGIHSWLYRQYASDYSACLVPSFGYPSSDALLTAALNPSSPSSLQAAIPTGRLAATSNTQVMNYLNKVAVYESTTPAYWQKNIIHLAGGNQGTEQTTILQTFTANANTAEGPYFGANVYLIQKNTTAPIQITLADSITNIINNGVSLMTFFGHAAGSNFDINLDAPSDYNNAGKYPLILALACFSGDIFQPAGAGASSTSEQFVLDPKGSIGFIAMDDVSEEEHLANYSLKFYPDFSTLMYRKPIGNCMQDVVGKLQAFYGGFYDQTADNMFLEMALHGDPAIILNGEDSLPDYAVNDSSLTFIPSNVTTQIDSFKVNLVVWNNAEALNQNVPVQIERIFPDNTDTIYNRTLKNVYNNGTISITMPVNKIKGPGMNYFNVSVDPGNTIKEITKSNNNLIKVPLLITSGDIIPIYPYQFAIIPKDTATLKCSTGDPFAPAHNYVFQIDTTIYFNSPFLKTQVINAKGGVVRASWKTWINTPHAPPVYPGKLTGPPVPLMFKDTIVYYWRVRRDTSDVKDYGWQVSSFQYITGKSGWGQSHYFQFDNNQYSYLQQNLTKRNWLFDTTGKTLLCNTYGNYPFPPQGYNNTTAEGATDYYLDFNLEAANGCQVDPALFLAVIDSTSLTPWSTQNHNFGENNVPGSGCNDVPDLKFIFRHDDPNAIKGLYTALADSIPSGDYILIYSWMWAKFHSWAGPDSLKLKGELISLGCSSAITTAKDSVPWIFFVKKGHTATAQTIIGKGVLDSLTLTVNLWNHEYYGTMTTPLIGPAQKWDSISWRQHQLLKISYDSVRLNVMTIDNNGNSSILLKGVTPAVANIYVKSVNPKQYPYLQMQLYTKDAVIREPSQMNKWQVFYTPVPEVAVNPSIFTSFYKTTPLIGGDTVKFSTVLQNVGDYTMDSMLVNSWIVDANNAIHYLPVKHTKIMNPGDTTLLTAKCSTSIYPGNCSIWIDANPEYLTQTRPEEYYFNNYAKKPFVAQPDKNNPLLDVTFDGVHIMNNDIVSPHPNILIQVTSDNKFLPLDKNDTGNIAVYIRNVNNPTPQRLYFDSPQIQFTPAVLPDNKCKVIYTPTFTDGTYELSVQAADRSNNVSGSNPYKIDFQVINKSSITNVLNYPNPFSTSTRFVFTITGDQLPTYFKIQIITITGKVVREITESELGPLHIGLNITEYAWDGTDQFGSKLANGVYLYRVISSINNQAIDHLSTDADSYFTKGWGKMYLLR
ncbi:MAG: C25 family cysteine peptidase [Bacteroidia bacterium]